jgi:hypothetical protein
MTGGDTTIGDQMLQLRREVARFDPDFETFHASNDPAPPPSPGLRADRAVVGPHRRHDP